MIDGTIPVDTTVRTDRTSERDRTPPTLPTLDIEPDPWRILALDTVPSLSAGFEVGSGARCQGKPDDIQMGGASSPSTSLPVLPSGRCERETATATPSIDRITPSFLAGEKTDLDGSLFVARLPRAPLPITELVGRVLAACRSNGPTHAQWTNPIVPRQGGICPPDAAGDACWIVEGWGCIFPSSFGGSLPSSPSVRVAPWDEESARIFCCGGDGCWPCLLACLGPIPES